MRRILLWAARNRWLKERLPRFRWVRRATRRFMPGETTEDALAAVATYQSWRIHGVLTLLGENVTDLSEAQVVADAYHALIDEIAARSLDVEFSLKLTQLGYRPRRVGRVRSLRRRSPGTRTKRGSWSLDRHGGQRLRRDRRSRSTSAPVPGTTTSASACRRTSTERPPTSSGCCPPSPPSAWSRARTTNRRRSPIARGRRSTGPSWPSRRSSSRPSSTSGRGSWRRPTTSPSSSA